MRYYSLNDYCKKTFGEKVYKLSLNAGMTCPNRDGSLSYTGCFYCSEGGSGDFQKPEGGFLPKQTAVNLSHIFRLLQIPMLQWNI